MKPSGSTWLTTAGMVFALAIALGGQGGAPNGGGEEEGYGNNLANPTIFAEGYGVTGFPTSLDPGIRPTAADLAASGSTDPTLPYWDNTEVYVKDGVTYYPQQTPSYWRTDWRNGVDAAGAYVPQHAIVNWSDNLLNQQWTSGSVIRVETALYQEALDPTDTMTAYTMTYLLGEGTTELWGSNKATAEVTRRAIFSGAARLKIEKISGPGGAVVAVPSSFNGSVAEGFSGDGPGFYGAEINVSGNLVYGYNWMLAQWPGTDAEKAGWWRLTFTLDPSVTYTISTETEEEAEPTATATYTYNRNAIFDAGDPADIADTVMFRPRLTDSYTSVLEIQIAEERTGGTLLPLGITLAGTGTGTVTSNPTGISCPTDCSENYAKDTVVALTAVAGSGSNFAGWSGDADCSDGMVTMTGGRYCTATFDGGGGSSGGGDTTPTEPGTGGGAIETPGQGSGGPHNLVAEVDGPYVTLSWTAPTDVSGITGYRIEGGRSSGATEAVIDLANQTSFLITVGNGTYFARVRAMVNGQGGPPSNEVAFAVTGAPTRPLAVNVVVNANRASLSWQPPAIGPVSGYEIHAGSSPGLADLGVIPVSAASRSLSANVGNGTYFVRVHAMNRNGRSAASNEVTFNVGAGVALPPGRPSRPNATVSGRTVTMSWLPGSGGAPTAHLLQVGSASGASDVGVFALSASLSFATSGVAPGTYFVRIVATNTFGASQPSEEVVVTVQ